MKIILSFRKYFILYLIIFIFGINTITAQTTGSCTQTATVSGYDCDNILAQLIINCAPADAIVTSTTITASINSSSGTSYCPNWYVVDIYAVGAWNYDLCNGTYSVNNIAGLSANGLVFGASSYDNDYYCDYVTITISVTVNYTSNSGGGSSGGGDGSSCDESIPFCAGAGGVTFPALADNGSAQVGPDYGCNCYQPNPTWYYLRIGNPGSITMTISSTAGDVDYAAWGPFSNVTCASYNLSAVGNPGCDVAAWNTIYGNLVDCSYSTASIETLTIPNAQSGQYYMVVIFNYVNIAGSINFAQTSGIGSTDCSIVAPPITNNGPLCTGQTLQLTANNPPSGAVFSWTGPNGFTSNQQNPTITNVSTANAGTYSLVITVGSVASAAVTTTVVINTYPSGVSISPNSGTLTCSTTSLNLTASATSPTSGLTYSWSNGASANTTTITTAGTYIVTISNSGCNTTASVTISSNITNPTVNINANPNPITCANPNATLTATSNPATGITYSWSNGASENVTTVTTAGNYTVTVTNTANNCTAVSSVVSITENKTPPTITFNPTSGQVTCAVPTVAVTASGGASYNWSDGLGTNAMQNLGAGTYSVTATASNGCTAIGNITISAGTSTFTTTLTPSSAVITCGITNVSTTANAGTGTFTYAWSAGQNPSSATNTFNSAGIYTVTVINTANGCSGTANFTVTTDNSIPQITIAKNPDVSVITCTNPIITLTANTIPTTGLTYSWSNGASTNSTTVTTAGTYSVIVTNPTNGCTTTANVTFTENKAPPIADIYPESGTLTCLITSIPVTASGGASYAWSSGLGNNANAIINNTGIYEVTVTGANGCTSTDNITITSNTTAPTAMITNNTNGQPTELNCSVTSISLTATGGGTYVWSGGVSTGSTTASITVTTGGIYSVTITGTNGCTAVADYNITQNINVPTAIITPSATTITCDVPSVTLTTTGGVSYVWSGGVSTGSTAASITVTTGGIYSVTITAANGCSATTSISIEENKIVPTVDIINNTGSTALTCAISSIFLTATGGGNYAWNNGSLGATTTVTEAGIYIVTVTNPINGCINAKSIEITEVPALQVTYQAMPITCYGGQTAIIVTATGGTPPYNSAETYNVYAGNYSYIVTDNGGCSANTGNINIIQPDQLIANSMISAGVGCAGQMATIAVTATGGTLPYSGIGTKMAPAGSHNFIVIDANGCTANTNIEITEPAPINLSIVQVSQVSCYGKTDAIIQAIVSGGTGNYDYIWNDNLATIAANLTEIGVGNYSVTITDNSGCTASSFIAVTQPQRVGAKVSMHNVSCYGLSDGRIDLNGAGGFTPYQYYVSNGVMISNSRVNQNLAAGDYFITIVDNRNCSFDTVATIMQPEEIIITPIVNNPSCVNGKNGIIDLITVGGFSPFYYYINDVYLGSNSQIRKLDEGVYNIRIKDSTGCEINIPEIRLTDMNVPCMYIPNGITPNGDGINDTWIIDGIYNFDNYEVRIFNRWGQTMFESINYEPWNGMYKNKKIPAGTYLYVIMIYGEKKYTGTITVIY